MVHHGRLFAEKETKVLPSVTLHTGGVKNWLFTGFALDSPTVTVNYLSRRCFSRRLRFVMYFYYLPDIMFFYSTTRGNINLLIIKHHKVTSGNHSAALFGGNLHSSKYS
jgi:hypothetical protein